MLPNPLSDASDFGIDELAQVEGIEGLIESRELIFSALRELRRVQDPLIWCFGIIMDLDDLRANPLLGLQLR